MKTTMAAGKKTEKELRALLAQFRYNEALKLLDSLSAADKKTPFHQAAFGLCYLHLQREPQALPFLAESWGKCPESKELGQKLVNHFYCRTLLAEKLGAKSDEGRELLAKAQAITDLKPGKVGITLSATMIMKNEAKNLDRTLTALKKVCDEIVIVDTGSTDNSVKIARKYGCKLGYYQWDGSFAAPRNLSLDMCTSDWALAIDCDEVVSEESIPYIYEGLMRPQFIGFHVPVINFTDDSHTETYVHTPVRIFQRVPEARITGKVHEQIAESLTKVGLPFATLEQARILHYGYTPQAMQEKNKMERTLKMLEAELRENPRSGYHWFNLANAHLVNHDYTQAEFASRQALKFVRGIEESWVGTLYHLAVDALCNLGRQPEALMLCDEAKANGFGGLINDYYRAGALHQLGRDKEALVAINESLKGTWSLSDSGDYTIYTYKRRLIKSQVLMNLGKTKEALVELDAILNEFPKVAFAQLSKGIALERLGEFDKALAHYRKAATIVPEVEADCLCGESRILLHNNKPGEAAAKFEKAWKLRPESSDAWVAWVTSAERAGDTASVLKAYESYANINDPNGDLLINWGRTLAQNGQQEKALHCFSEALKRDPENPNAYFNCGDLLYQMGHFADAAHVYEAGLRHQPMNASGWFVLGNSLAKLGIVAGAKIAYQQALNLEPSYEEAQNNLAALEQLDHKAA
ncbi:MAG: tetratricopeptide repeat protein [Armatimonadetes bacterium]|nr:tetratricopeptide repeat protein [Armatimonadota bacterium]